MPIFLSVKVLLSVLRWQISKQKKQMPSMLEYDLLYGSETRLILSVGFFFFFIEHGTVLGTRLSHTQIGPPQVFNSISFVEHPRLSQPPSSPLPPPPPPPSPGDVQRFTDYNEIHVNHK